MCILLLYMSSFAKFASIFSHLFVPSMIVLMRRKFWLKMEGNVWLREWLTTLSSSSSIVCCLQ